MPHFLDRPVGAMPPHLADIYDETSFWSARFGALLLYHLDLRRGIRGLDVGCGTGFALIELAQLHGPAARFTGIDVWSAALARARLKARLHGLDNVAIVEAAVCATLERKKPQTALELACGTGLFTRFIAPRVDSLTAVDALPEVIAINRARVASDRVRYVEADLFEWTPDRQFDCVFMSFWLSHVPFDRFDAVRQRMRLLIRRKWSAIPISHCPKSSPSLLLGRRMRARSRPSPRCESPRALRLSPSITSWMHYASSTGKDRYRTALTTSACLPIGDLVCLDATCKCLVMVAGPR